MPRPLRIEYPGAWYHVMNRGANRKNIYKKEVHFFLFLEILAETCKKFQIEIHAYCLMTNHYHLLIHTPLGNLSRAMRHINGIYTQRYNRMQKKDGPLFRGRYKAILVQKDGYLLQLSRYIHLNPVEAKINTQPEKYRWSSYSSYTSNIPQFSWLKTHVIFEMLSQTNQIEAYRNFISKGVSEEIHQFFSSKKKSRITGDDCFKKEILAGVPKKYIKACSTDFNATRFISQSEDIIMACIEYYCVPQNSFFISLRGKVNRPRMVAIYLHRKLTQLSLSEISSIFGLGAHSAVTNTVFRIEKLMQKDKGLAKEIELISDRLV